MKRLTILLVLVAAGAVAACTPSNTGSSPTLPAVSTEPSLAPLPSSEAPASMSAPSDSGSGLPSDSSSPASS